MREKAEPGSVPVPTQYMNAQSAIVGLRGKDMLSTLRMLVIGWVVVMLLRHLVL